MTNRTWALIVGLLTTLTATAAHYYISPKGNDVNSGRTARKAFASLATAQALVEPGDTVWILPGTYLMEGESEAVFLFEKSGEAGRPICYIGQCDDTGNRPVFDLSAVELTSKELTGFLVSGDYLLMKNFEISGLLANDSTTDVTTILLDNFLVTDASHNSFENIACHDSKGNGFRITGNSSQNLFINCDSYLNSNGFICCIGEDMPNNILIGCRTWNNLNTGYDFSECYSAMTCAYSIAYRNGYDSENTGQGEGNGFLAGGYGMDTITVSLPSKGAPMHEIHHSISSSNRANGFYSNHHLGGLSFHHNTAYRNGRFNYNLANRMGKGKDEATEVNGYGHQLECNLSMVADGKDNHITLLRGDEGDNTIKDNSFFWVFKNSGGWDYTAYGNSVFESTRVADFTTARNADGSFAEATLSVMRQKDYLGLGCTFDGYQSAIDDVRSISGAGENDGTTGIHTVWQTSTSPETIYGMTGRQVRSPGKGLYIMNGKKIIIR